MRWPAERTRFALVAVAVATGAAILALGSRWGTWMLIGHAVAGTAVVLEAGVALTGIGRSRRRALDAVVTAVLVGIAGLGLLHAVSGTRTVLGRRVLPAHIGLGLVAVPLVGGWWVIRRARRRSDGEVDAGRRAFVDPLRLAAGALVLSSGLEGVGRVLSLPGSRRRFTGSYERGSLDAAAMPVAQWLTDTRVDIAAAEWRLVVHDGASSRAWSYAELSAIDDHLRATLDCTSGWYSTQDWNGVLLSRLLGPAAAASSVVVRSTTGYSRRFPAGDAGHLLLATRLGDRPLTPEHGFPLRLVAPNRRGFWWVKWVTAVETSDRPWWWQSPFPLQ